jgi:hypothetical protein
MKNIDASCTRKQFLVGSSAAAVSLFCGHNARMDIFAATMLGQIDIVSAAVAAFPNIVHVPGPHGIPLIAHAEEGGPAAKAVLEFLRPLVDQPQSRG